MTRSIADSACEVAEHYGSRTFYSNAANMVGVRTRGMFVWHGWDSSAGGYVVTGSTVNRGWNVTHHRCESGVPVAVRSYKKRPRAAAKKAVRG